MGNFGLTISDSSFWQKSFSARPEATFPGYLTASIAILSNAWSIGAILGSATLFLENDPSFPTYPRKMTEYEIASGFPLPYIVKATLGKHAVGGLLLIIYLSVTSTVSAQMISVSSIISYDIYKKYVKPKANNKQVIRISHLSVVAFGFFAAGFSIMLHYVGITMTFMGYFISNVICVAVFPLALSILWDRQTRLAATVSPIIGMIAAFIVWVLVSRKFAGGELNATTLSAQVPCLYSGLTALFLPGLLSVIISLVYKPYKYDWNKFKEAQLVIASEEARTSQDDSTSNESINQKYDEKNNNYSVNESPQKEAELESLGLAEKTDKLLKKYTRLAAIAFVVTLLVTWVIWPFAMYRDWIMTEAYYKGYIVVGLIWLYATLIVIGLFPIWEGRHAIKIIVKGLYRDYIKREKPQN
ncbi:hypothetical protein HYPBUDRAFT_152218 [Hyphopichia burtonii NRRL Y-1933]|uniref:Urea active transporter n=1 Tax=Hyphopichia burtonii NRRL Y-1933 TaxID=984485 RepID=A0A1E4RPF8_9ASCO|nr:hypothetical protein HYPBUDRAFT_152218 [Hyphopichia burtonii NRRL Y-1933]ODV68975.1 hypothetical protein HYPBUDRAFT_152218 [Hyphopichia burtonii NRRL Y-1933]